MAHQFIKVKAVREAFHELRKLSTPEVESWLDRLVKRRIDALAAVHNGGRKKIDSTLCGHVAQ